MASQSPSDNTPVPTPFTSFPQDPAEFDSDPRISFSKLDNKFILETEDGQEYVYDSVLKRWIPTVDDDLLQQQQEAYKIQGVDETEQLTAQQLRKKRKQQGGADENNSQKPKKQRVNTAVYVTSIPLDAEFEEIRDVFSKCGVIAEEIDSGRPRIKMYMDEDGKFKGEALVVYFRPESVNLAIQMLDDSDFRLGVAGPQGPMKVQLADFSFKSQQEAPAKTSMRDKKKIIRRTQKLNSKLADWDDDDPSMLPDTSSRFEKVVILKHMFTLEELEEDPAAILDIKQDIRDECSKLGEVTNVVLYDKEPDGVASVRFVDPEAARQCVRVMDGRFFAGTRVEAYVSDGKEKFRKTNEKRAALEDMAERGLDAEDDEENERLDEFGTWLESSHVVENRAK
ncbi:U2 snRNP complex subunit CUS2 [Aspergillus clavatus NRRL 1]|uniref:Nuclear mRNA splicing factor-associated protein, putative n=1 Tax=Aspergillus clavatus (strain ATCC 1007 / CBS 513.65 / DSM 816 / NCTC 3887 / NRRL 1 / QM 1276 / 107) TaxID=344612 RepID=A1CQ22_ASPCL|nr:nuclear mRNA splicing factor-associated protein, putative [Aspergillus clavatus NRRL 1]EAW07743.1 nuclear mRNA splicing factor-associated protein, putative [Aspergillus clavatus NRRL 1]